MATAIGRIAHRTKAVDERVTALAAAVLRDAAERLGGQSHELEGKVAAFLKALLTR